MDGDFHVAEWLVEPDLNTVCRNGETVHLQPKVMKVLVCLAQRAGKPVSKEELLNLVWAETFVGDDVLKRSISELRRVFGDDVQAPSIIQTIPKRGYRLVARVQPATVLAMPPAEEANQSTKAAPGRKTMLAVAILSLVLLALAAAVVYGWKQPSPAQTGSIRIRSLAVLPLENLSADPEQAYFSEGMTDGLITDLAQIGSLKVISRTSSMQYGKTRKSLPEIARELKVDGIVEGTVQRSRNRVRITAQLIEASSDNHLWAHSYDGDLSDALELEKRVAEDIANQVMAHVADRNQSSTTPSKVVDSRALDEYLQGTYHINRFSRGSGDDELKVAADHFQRAIEIDQKFALAYVGLANSHLLTFQSSNDDLQIATQAAQRALELDPGLSDAWEMLAEIKTNFWNWEEAEADVRRAIALNPNKVYAHELLADLLDIFGKRDDAWKEYEIAQELDPDQDHLEYPLHIRQEYDRAIEGVRRALVRDPNNAYLHHQLFENYSAKGMHKEAIEELRQSVTQFGFPELAVKLRDAYAASGYKGAMREYAAALESLHAAKKVFMPINIATAYAAVGNKDRAFYWLEEGYRQRGHQSAGVDFAEIGVYPGLDPLHSDPRFKSLLQRMGLPDARIDDSGRVSNLR
jgi:TolB-like protein/DNA-binding winged helix-turn-helix (wHTH) protein